MLHDEVLEDVPHQMWVFTIPRMLRVYFLHHRELLGELSRIAYETVQELMATACFEDDSFRPGMVSVVQTFGEAARFHPHVHGLCSRGGWNARGEWIPVPYVDTQKAEGTVKLANRAPISWRSSMRRQPYLGVESALKPST